MAMGFASSQRKNWLWQRFDREDILSKFVMSLLSIVATFTPILLLYNGYQQGFAWGILAVALVCSAGSAYLVRQIIQNNPAPFFVGLTVLAIAYWLIAITSWGIDPIIAAYWPALCAGIAAIGIIVVITIVWVPRHENGENAASLTPLEILGVVLLSIAALAVRVYAIEQIPVARNIEAHYSLEALRTLAGGGNNPIAIGLGDTALLYSILQGMSMQLFGTNLAGGRVINALMGSGTIVMLYFATRLFFDRRTAWLTALALLAMGIHLEFSRTGLIYLLDSLLLSSVLAMLAYGWETGQRRFYVGAGVALGLCQYAYHTGKIIPIIFALWLVLVAIQNWELIQSRLSQLTLMWSISLLVALPFWWNIATHWEHLSSAIMSVSLFASVDGGSTRWIDLIAESTQQPLWLQLLVQFRDAAAAFVVVPLRDGYDTGSPLLILPSAVLFIVGVLLMVREYRDPRYWLLFIGLCSAVGVVALTIDTPAAQRMVYISPFVAIVIGIGLAESGKWFRLEWIQSDWSIPPIVVQIFSIVVAIAIAGYDGYTYLQRNSLRNDSLADQSAAQISSHIQNYPAGAQVYLFTQPMLRYDQSALIALQAPQVTGTDVYPPLQAPPMWVLDAPMNSFVFSPDRIAELAFIRQQYPGGKENRVYRDNGEILLIFYDVSGVSTLSAP
jgi:4-amino-4-deoxy-L-arabinose transferase-like glycosyltransferase